MCAAVTAAYDHVACPMEFANFVTLSAKSRVGSAGDAINVIHSMNAVVNDPL